MKLLPCMHMYHQACIDAWLERSHVCPVCQVGTEGLAAVPGVVWGWGVLGSAVLEGLGWLFWGFWALAFWEGLGGCFGGVVGSAVLGGLALEVWAAVWGL